MLCPHRPHCSHCIIGAILNCPQVINSSLLQVHCIPHRPQVLIVLVVPQVHCIPQFSSLSSSIVLNCTTGALHSSIVLIVLNLLSSIVPQVHHIPHRPQVLVVLVVPQVQYIPHRPNCPHLMSSLSALYQHRCGNKWAMLQWPPPKPLATSAWAPSSSCGRRRAFTSWR